MGKMLGRGHPRDTYWLMSESSHTVAGRRETAPFQPVLAGANRATE